MKVSLCKVSSSFTTYVEKLFVNQQKHGILLSAKSDYYYRLCTHYEITAEDIPRVPIAHLAVFAFIVSEALLTLPLFSIVVQITAAFSAVLSAK